MFIVNSIFVVFYFVSECLFFASYRETIGAKFVAIQFIYEILRVIIECVILYLAAMFGRSVKVNSQVTADGQLVITGKNELNQEYFNFTLKQERQTYGIESELNEMTSNNSTFLDPALFDDS